MVNRCDKQLGGRHIKTSLTEVVEESIPAYPVVVECTVAHRNPAWLTPEARQDSTGRVDRVVVRASVEELLAEPECLRTCEASCRNNE